jgi:glycosyltransferase involved in cell wall biosynthesis
MKKPHIALLMMVKNEKKRLQVTLDSVKGFVDSLIIFDTGSTDNTLEILQTFSESANIPLHLKQGEFVNFSESRNESLHFAETIADVDFLLLLDCNDELQNGKDLVKFAKQELNTHNKGYLVMQEWFSGNYNQYYNIRFIRNYQGWIYKGVVHEWITIPEQPHLYITQKIPSVKLYQDRTQDDDKSGKRFIRDRELLLAEHDKNPDDARTVFYLAQTCGCLQKWDEAYKYYLIRSDMPGFDEETYHSFVRLGDTCQGIVKYKYRAHKERQEAKLGPKPDDEKTDTERFYDQITWQTALMWYLKAFEVCDERIEGLIPIIEYYRAIEKWKLAYTFSKLACDLTYPNKFILFNDNEGYEYKRWHLMGIIAFYYGEADIGYKACQIAINARGNDIDKSNLNHYRNQISSNKLNEMKRKRDKKKNKKRK